MGCDKILTDYEIKKISQEIDEINEELDRYEDFSMNGDNVSVLLNRLHELDQKLMTSLYWIKREKLKLIKG